MSANCCNHTPDDQLRDSRYRRVLWAALIITAGMFFIEIIAGVAARSTSLQVDALAQRHHRQLCRGAGGLGGVQVGARLA